MPSTRFEAERVLASPPALGALDRLVATLRSTGYANELLEAAAPDERVAARLALGHTIGRADIQVRDVAALVDAGAADVEDDRLVPRFALFASGSTYVLVPRDDGFAPDRVYFGLDSLWLAELARRAGPGRGLAADLGTGAGLVAASLTATYDIVVATDLLPRTAASAAITLRLNGGGTPCLVCVADVAGGLRTGAFALVTANPPWVPNLDGDAPRVYAEGGVTGFELPRRFTIEAVSLLAPGGVAVLLAIDVIWQDGSRPLTALARGLRRMGHEVAVIPTDATTAWRTMDRELMTRFEAMAAVEHVAVLVRRPE